MTAELVPYINGTNRGWIEMLTPAAELAKQIASTEFVPAPLRNKPAAIAACILYGDELGLGPMQSLAKIDIVDGRPAPSAQLGLALVLGAGHDVWVEESTNTRCTVAGKRHNSSAVQKFTYSMDDAKRAGIDNKQNWRRYPADMLRNRAVARACRMIAPDALGGIALFSEELDDHDDPQPVAETNTETNSDTKTRKRSLPKPKPATPYTPPIATEQQDEEPAASAPPPPLPGDTANASRPQITKIMVLLGAAGIKTRDDRLALCTGIVGRHLETSNDLTVEEASTLIEVLEAVERGDAFIETDDNASPIGVAWTESNQ